jgi:hypothetical protein
MLKNLEFKKEIYVSIVVTILTIIFIDPIIKLVWSGMIWFGTNMYQGFLNSMYKGASLGHRNHVDAMLFMLLCSGVIGVFAGRIANTINKPPVLFEKIDKSPRLKKALVITFYSIGIIVFLILATNVFVDLQLNASFQQRLTVLAPKISEQEHKEILASWANMKTREDYELIVSHMDSVAEQNDIKLPDLLLK